MVYTQGVSEVLVNNTPAIRETQNNTIFKDDNKLKTLVFNQ